MRFFTKYIWILGFILSITQLVAQENVENKDTLKLPVSKVESHISDSAFTDGVKINIPTTHPLFGKSGLATNKFSDFSINPYLMPRTIPSRINFHGAASDDIFSKSRTAVASYSPVSRMNLYAGTTLGLVETPFFGKGNYYILNAGAGYILTPNLNAGVSAMYNSDFGVLPFWNISADLQYLASRNLMLEGSIGYTQTASNILNMHQSAVLADLHVRQRLSDDWYLNAYGGFPVSKNTNQPGKPMMPVMNNTYYGGTVEYWFKPTVGAEAGLIWVRDVFSGKMRPQPKIELKFRPGR